MKRLAEIMRELYALTNELERRFPGRKFTPDGHMVGSIGEAWAVWLYQVELLRASTPQHDAKAADGRLVQIKATQGKGVALSSEPDHLLVLKLHQDGSPEEVYNGPGAPVWAAAGKMGKNGQRPISVQRLRALMKTVAEHEKIPRVSAEETDTGPWDR